MSVSPIIWLVCMIAGCCSGLVAGARHSIVLAVVGGFIGCLIGYVAFLAPTIPYVGWIIWYEKRHPNNDVPPKAWGLLFVPLMIVTVFLSVILSLLVVGGLAAMINPV